MDGRYSLFLKGVSLYNHTSQFGEDALLEAIFNRIGTDNKWCLEVGAADGIFFSNTRKFIQEGWSAVQIDPDEGFYEGLKERYKDNPKVHCINAFVTLTPGERLDDILTSVGAPIDIDLLVIDVDGQDFHLWNSIVKYRPRVVVAEYNSAVDPMYIPEPGGPGQAGNMAMSYMAKAKGYQVICRTPTNLICARNDLAHLLEEKIQNHTNGHKVSVEPQKTVFIEDPVSGAKSLEQIGVVSSVPRLGFQAHSSAMFKAFRPYNVSYLKMTGVYWEQQLQKGLSSLIEQGCTYIFTVDYDSIFTDEHIRELLTLAVRYPEAGAIVPMQVRRGGMDMVLTGFRDKNGDLLKSVPRSTFNSEVTPIDIGHFGLTLIKVEALQNVTKPWLWSLPNPGTGEWDEGKVDADIYFWNKFRQSGRIVYSANKIRIGHIDEHIIWVGDDMQVVRQTMSDFYSKGSPQLNGG